MHNLQRFNAARVRTFGGSKSLGCVILSDPTKIRVRDYSAAQHKVGFMIPAEN